MSWIRRGNYWQDNPDLGARICALRIRDEWKFRLWLPADDSAKGHEFTLYDSVGKMMSKPAWQFDSAKEARAFAEELGGHDEHKSNKS